MGVVYELHYWKSRTQKRLDLYFRRNQMGPVHTTSMLIVCFLYSSKHIVLLLYL
jgi:hypothetical protein